MLEGKARAKINLDLRVLDQRADGYHDVATLFARIALHDTVAVSGIDRGVELEVHGDAGGANGPDNLAHKAATALRRRVARTSGVRVELTKRIPTGAGLGGGSADAGATLRLVNALWEYPLNDDELTELGASLGADVPFLASDRSAAWGFGRGDQLTPAALPAGGVVLLAMPNVHVGTADAYRQLREYRAQHPPTAPAFPTDADLASWVRLAERCTNDFESAIHARHPELLALHASMLSCDALLVRMSGSGAAHFALFAEQADAEIALDRLTNTHKGVEFLITHFE